MSIGRKQDQQDRKRQDGQDDTWRHHRCLAVTDIRVGLLVNFGRMKLECKRMYHPTYPAACDRADPVSFWGNKLFRITAKSKKIL